jgi:hypothetical protein
MDRNGAGNRAWPGLDFMTIDSGINPFVASYEGAPYMLRGTDPASYSRDAVGWWQSLRSPAPAPETNSPGIMPASWSFGLPGTDALKAVGIGAAGVLLALLVVAFGLLVLVKSD